MRPSHHIAPGKRRPHRRRLLALLACALWVLSFEAAPNFHIGFHSLFAHHHHHGDSDTEHSDAGQDDNKPDHGSKSFEHRGVATLSAPPPIVIVAVNTFEIVTQLEQVEERVQRRQPQSIRVRGPPILS